MTNSITVACTCGKLNLRVEGPHVASAECLCSSCRNAGHVLASLPGAPPVLDGKGATAFVMHRKDRLRAVAGAENLKAYRLSSDAGTRRVVAVCCNTPSSWSSRGAIGSASMRNSGQKNIDPPSRCAT